MSIGIADGVYKAEIIHAVLSLHLINAFFTNKETALSLLAETSDIV
nr:sugar-binding domain-containing protein [uncultured Anaerostipes sp.]